MAIISFRQRLHDLFGDTLNLEQGWRQGTWNEYFRSYPEDYPYRDQDGHISVAAFLDSLLWPSTYTEEQAHPEKAELPYSNRIQGITSYICPPGELYWIISQNKKQDGEGQLTFLQSSKDLTAPPFKQFFISEPELKDTGAHHFGDPCVFNNNFILVPYEGTEFTNNAPDNEKAPLLAIFQIMELNDPPDQTTHFYPNTLGYIGYVYLSRQGTENRQAPWCASHKDIVFSSRFSSLGEGDASLSPELYIYKLKTTPLLSITPRTPSHEYTLKKNDGSSINIRRIQGGDISPQGHIYLVSDVSYYGEIDENNNTCEGGGIHMFDLTTGRWVNRIKIDGHQTTFGIYAEYELEGICIRDADLYPKHQLTNGQIHMCVFDFDWIDGYKRYNDQAWIRHWSVVHNEKQYI